MTIAVIHPAGGVDALGAMNVLTVRTGDDVEAAVFGGGVIDGRPCRDAGSGFREQVEIVLMHALAPSAGGLEIIHRLGK